MKMGAKVQKLLEIKDKVKASLTGRSTMAATPHKTNNES